MIDSSGILQMLAGCESSLAKTKTVHTHPKLPLARPQIDRHAASISGKLSHSELVSMVCPGKYSAENWEKGGVATITPLSGSPYVVSTH